MAEDLQHEQESLCRRFGVEYCAVTPELSLGIAPGAKAGALPLNGLRRVPQGAASGWYLWVGEEPPAEEAVFLPLPLAQLAGICPAALKYLGFPPGWRFIVAAEYEDVWQDPTLL